MARCMTRSKSSVTAASMLLAALWGCGRTDPTEALLAEPGPDAAQEDDSAAGSGGDGGGTSPSGGIGGSGGGSQCPENETICSGAGCVNLSNNPEHCGRCGQTCTASQVCENGVCACPAGMVPCGSSGCCPPTAPCGDGSCADGESCSDCPADCGPCAGCGDQVCNGTETCASCEADCGACASCSCREFCRILRRCGTAGPMCRSLCDTATPSYVDCVCRSSGCEEISGCF